MYIISCEHTRCSVEKNERHELDDSEAASANWILLVPAETVCLGRDFCTNKLLDKLLGYCWGGSCVESALRSLEELQLPDVPTSPVEGL